MAITKSTTTNTKRNKDKSNLKRERREEKVSRKRISQGSKNSSDKISPLTPKMNNKHYSLISKEQVGLYL